MSLTLNGDKIIYTPKKIRENTHYCHEFKQILSFIRYEGSKFILSNPDPKLDPYYINYYGARTFINYLSFTNGTIKFNKSVLNRSLFISNELRYIIARDYLYISHDSKIIQQFTWIFHAIRIFK
jgi:hypothetical protein